MARISELHYSNAYASSSGVSEFLEIALSAGESAADFTVSFYQANGSVGLELTLDQAGVQETIDPDSGETVYVISADDFPIFLTDPDGNGSSNYEAYALTDTSSVPGTVIDFYDIGGGTQNILASGGAASGATSENLPVIVGPESTTTTLQFNQPDPDTLVYEAVNEGYSGVACFVVGALIETPDGPRAIETLKPGDLVLTQDSGACAIRWIGSQTVAGDGRFAPVCFKAGVLGATRDTYVSQQHRILIGGWQSELLFGAEEILVPAKALVNGGTVQVAPRDQVTYYHVLFDQHEILIADGLASESFFPGDAMPGAVGSKTAEEFYALFPELRDRPELYGPTARVVQGCYSVSALSIG